MLDLTYIDVVLYTTSENFDKYIKFFKRMSFMKNISDYFCSENSRWKVTSIFNDEKFFFNINLMANKIPMYDNSDIVIIDGEVIPDWILNYYAGNWDNEKHHMIYTELKKINLEFIRYLAHRVLDIYYRNVEEGY